MKKQTNIKNDKDNFRQIMEMLIKIHDKLERMNKAKEALEGDELLDNQDMCMMLGVSKRTLQRYRTEKKVKYYMVKGKPYYLSSEIKNFFEQKGKNC